MFSLRGISLKRKIWVSVSLVTLLPLIALLYYLNDYYISWLTIMILGTIIFLGWFLIFEVAFTILRVHSQSKATLEKIGEASPLITNEVESLESIINVLTSKVRSSFVQLKEFSQKTEQLNKEVSKKVTVLSTILQANELFSKKALPEEIIQFLAQRLKGILEMEVCFCTLKSDVSEKFRAVVSLGIDGWKVENIFKDEKKVSSQIKRTIILDRKNKSGHLSDWAEKLELTNMAVSGIASKGRTIGVIAVGNNKGDFAFDADDLDTLNLVSQNIALIWEHKRLSVKVEGLEILDYLTDLYNKKFIVERLAEEIKRAVIYQRPCGFLLMEIADYDDYQKKFGIIKAEELLKKVSKIFKESLRPIDIGGRIAANRLAAIVIEKNKRKTHDVVDTISEKLKFVFKDQARFRFAIAENPLDGTTAQELIQYAQSHIGSKDTDGISQKS